jgi:hypothetical protein
VKDIVYIGLDDTDILGESPGTGRVARELAQHLEGLGFGESLGVSRHQLLVDPRIPYTSHNSSLCLALETGMEFEEFIEPCVEYVQKHHKRGSDPGVCISDENAITHAIVEFGWRATREILTKTEAIKLASRQKLVLKELGGTGDGIIGALAAVALRADGNQGRFVDLWGIRDISGNISVGSLLACTGIEAVQDEEGNTLSSDERIESYDWVRPSLRKGEIVLRVRPLDEIEHLWEPVENRKDKLKKA